MNLHEFDEEVFEFLERNKDLDPYQVSLSGKRIGTLPASEVAKQIQARQKIKNKVPVWYQTKKLIYPSPVSVEQSSSVHTAQYKADHFSGEILVDLTGGLGIDSYFFSKSFAKVCYNDNHQELMNLAAYNFNILNVPNVAFYHHNAEDFFKNEKIQSDLVYADPDRRNVKNNKTWKLENSTPDVLKLLPGLPPGIRKILLKLSPFLDLNYLYQSFGFIKELHVLSINNECKEVLLYMDRDFLEEPLLIAIEIWKDRSCCIRSKWSTIHSPHPEYGKLKEFIYVPGASIMKTGLFKVVSDKYKVTKIHPNSHLFTSEELVPDFPGKCLKIEKIYNYYDFYRTIPFNKANLIVRNFPERPEEIANKIRLESGNSNYLIATRDIDQRYIIIHATLIY